VKPEWLARARGVALFHVSWGGVRDYRRDHIPGAIHFDTNRIERPPLWKLIPDADLERALLELGVTRTTPVVLYGKPTMAATRVALALLYAGVEDVRILDGGLDAWRASPSGTPGSSGGRGSASTTPAGTSGAATPPTRSQPYLSTLSDVFVVATMAAPSTCEFKDCAGGSRHNIVCAKVNGFRYNCKIYQGFWLSQGCPG
jgi:rhodanese-related sulfurtransferase